MRKSAPTRVSRRRATKLCDKKSMLMVWCRGLPSSHSQVSCPCHGSGAFEPTSDFRAFRLYQTFVSRIVNLAFCILNKLLSQMQGDKILGIVPSHLPNHELTSDEPRNNPCKLDAIAIGTSQILEEEKRWSSQYAPLT